MDKNVLKRNFLNIHQYYIKTCTLYNIIPIQMKRILIIIPLIAFVVTASAQSRKVKEKDIIGTWKLVIDIDSEDLRDEIDEEDSFFGRIVLQSVAGLIDGILDGIDIELEFMKNNEVKVYVNAFGAEEVEYTDWHINRRGELLIGDTDSFQHDDDYWVFDGDVLVAYDDDNDIDSEVYLVNID